MASLKLVTSTPKPINEPPRLTRSEIELLSDYIVDSVDDPRINCALLLLLDELEHLSINSPIEIESVCAFAKDRSYNRLTNIYRKRHKGGQNDLIAQLRKDLIKDGEL